MENEEYHKRLMIIISNIKEENRIEFISKFNEKAHNPVVVFGLNVFVGYFGVDKFILGQPIVGVLKLISFGGVGLWILVDIFLIGSAVRKKNITIAKHYDGKLITIEISLHYNKSVRKGNKSVARGISKRQ